MKKWIVALCALFAGFFISCSGHGSNSQAPDNSETDSSSSSSGNNGSDGSSESLSENGSSGKDSSTEKGASSSSFGDINSSASVSTDSSSYLDLSPSERPFSYVIENTEMKLDLKSLTVTDKRDGNVYDVEWGDSSVIMVKYLNYEVKDKSWCYNDYEKNCERFGRLYSLEGAFCPHHQYTNNSPQGPCPLGWKVSWSLSPLGAPGYIVDDTFSKLTQDGMPWGVRGNQDNCYDAETFHKAFAIRCRYRWPVVAPDSVTKPTPKEFKKVETPADLPTYDGPYGEFIDVRDGNIYKTVEIGKQTWMAENLKYAHDDYRCYESCAENKHMGILYTWQAATGMKSYNRQKHPTPYQGVCPKGWRLPTKSDWRELFDYVLEQTNGVFVGKPLRSIDGWDTEEPAGTNSFGFNVISAGGHRSGLPDYGPNMGDMYFIVADDSLESTVWFMRFPQVKDETEPRLYANTYGDYKLYAYVRCVKGEGLRTVIDPAEDEPEELSSSSESEPKEESSSSQETE